MDEEQWLACEELARLLTPLRGTVNERQFRLFAVACCRRVWHLLTDGRSRRAVEVAERHADGRAGTEEVAEAAESAPQAITSTEGEPAALQCAAHAAYAAAAFPLA